MLALGIGLRYFSSRTRCLHSTIVQWTSRRSAHTTNDSRSVLSEENPARYTPGGYHAVHINEIFHNRFKVISKLGFGLYSTVWLAKDLRPESSNYVALKILTADSHGGSKSTFELDILKHLKRTDRTHPGSQHVVHLLDDFVHPGPNGMHLCLAMELMGQSVGIIQRQAPMKQIPQHIARSMTTQMLQALDWLHSSCHIIHTDIKPDNILMELPGRDAAVEAHLAQLHAQDDGTKQICLRSNPILPKLDSTQNTNFRLADFGVASWHDKHLTEWIQPPSLRAPEVFLKASWSYPADIWSLACVTYELLQGRVLFRGRAAATNAWTAEEDQLAQMIELFGKFPQGLLDQGRMSKEYFDEQGKLRHIKQLHPCSLQDLIAQTKNDTMSTQDYRSFEALLVKMLKLDPSERLSAKALLQEPWLSP